MVGSSRVKNRGEEENLSVSPSGLAGQKLASRLGQIPSGLTLSVGVGSYPEAGRNWKIHSRTTGGDKSDR